MAAVAEFVEWWGEKERGKGKRSNNADPRYFIEQAESLTGITQAIGLRREGL